ncbi:MAG: hypothetical protein KC588_16620 [Nitrospira sp.]|nr:hypothetical protein [Nitrospira sp.]
MELKDIFFLYLGKMKQIHLYQRAIQKIATKELEELNEFEKSIENHPDLIGLSSAYHRMSFRIAKDGSDFIFGKEESTIKDRKLAVILHKNKQYQWLLAEAYEEI